MRVKSISLVAIVLASAIGLSACGAPQENIEDSRTVTSVEAAEKASSDVIVPSAKPSSSETSTKSLKLSKSEEPSKEPLAFKSAKPSSKEAPKKEPVSESASSTQAKKTVKSGKSAVEKSKTSKALTSGGRDVAAPGKYTTNRAGLNDRYFTSEIAKLYASVGGSVRIGDIPKGSVLYRDVITEKRGGQLDGWIFARTQGASGWIKTSSISRNLNKSTSNGSGITRSQIKAQPNGRVPDSMLVAIPWDSEKTLIAAPALKDLTSLNTAFKKNFGKNLDIDLAYRTLDTQKYLYGDLGPYIAAKPGTSNHGWGLAIDVPENFNYSFDGKYYKWLKKNSHKYNWIHQKYLEKGSKFAEAWHFEYEGK